MEKKDKLIMVEVVGNGGERLIGLERECVCMSRTGLRERRSERREIGR